MILLPTATQTVWVLTAPLVVDHGAQVEDWDSPDVGRVRVDRCVVEPLLAREVLANRDASQAAWRVTLPAVTAHGDPLVITGRNRLEWSGVAHNIIGEPPLHRSASGTLDHYEVLCESWRG